MWLFGYIQSPIDLPKLAHELFHGSYLFRDDHIRQDLDLLVFFCVGLFVGLCVGLFVGLGVGLFVGGRPFKIRAFTAPKGRARTAHTRSPDESEDMRMVTGAASDQWLMMRPAYPFFGLTFLRYGGRTP
eukprot:scaffold49489_cov34-Attheya_sp.AAC.1